MGRRRTRRGRLYKEECRGSGIGDGERRKKEDETHSIVILLLILSPDEDVGVDQLHHETHLGPRRQEDRGIEEVDVDSDETL